jgi:hypothetical protein
MNLRQDSAEETSPHNHAKIPAKNAGKFVLRGSAHNPVCTRSTLAASEPSDRQRNRHAENALRIDGSAMSKV